MDLRLNQERVEYHACVLDRTMEDMFTSDVVVPDTLADVGEIVLADGDFCLWRLDLASGSAEAEGEWKGSVCYRAENDGLLQRFPVSVGVRLRLHDDAIEPGLKPYSSCRVTECAVQIMNTRKLRIKIRISMSLQCYANQAMELTCSVKEAPPDLYFKTEQHTSSLVTDVSEQVFTAGERIRLQQAPEGAVLLASHSEVQFDPPQRSGSRAILRGVVHTGLLYQGSETKLPVYETVNTTFSQLLDLDGLTEADTLCCCLQLTSADLILHEAEDLETDFHLVVQTLCVREQELRYLSDAYSVSDELKLNTEPLQFVRRSGTETMTVYAEGELKNAPENASVFSACARLCSANKTKDAASGTAEVTILFVDAEGSLCSRCAEAKFTQELPEYCDITDINLGQPVVTAGADCLQIRVPVQLAYERITTAEARQIISVEKCDASSVRHCLPSLTLIPRTENMDLWETAKHYCSTTDAIQAANRVSDGEKPTRYCVIPRVKVG